MPLPCNGENFRGINCALDTVMNRQISNVILVADHEEDWRDLLGIVIRRCGFDVLEAKTGSEALDGAMSAAPRLILLEFGLPDINGCEVMARLKHNSATQNIPVFFQLTELDAQDIRWPDGAKEILYKPFDLGDLPGLLRKHLALPPAGILPGSSKTNGIR